MNRSAEHCSASENAPFNNAEQCSALRSRFMAGEQA